MVIGKNLDNIKRKSAIIYVKDLIKYARVLLAIKEMTFKLN